MLRPAVDGYGRHALLVAHVKQLHDNSSDSLCAITSVAVADSGERIASLLQSFRSSFEAVDIAQTQLGSD
jgi:hypothetical protein